MSSSSTYYEKQLLINDCTRSYNAVACENTCFQRSGEDTYIDKSLWTTEIHTPETNVCIGGNRDFVHDSPSGWAMIIGIGGIALFFFLWWFFFVQVDPKRLYSTRL